MSWCPECYGSGEIFENGKIMECPICLGDGWIQLFDPPRCPCNPDPDWQPKINLDVVDRLLESIEKKIKEDMGD